jgi:sugar phosphate isomerase/epimerase
MGGEDTIGFVLDVGHAYTLDRLGFYPFQEWLERFSARIIGTHLHDVVGLADHFAPGLGEIDFDLVARYLPRKANRTCEFQAYNHFEQVKVGLKYLLDHHCITIIH